MMHASLTPHDNTNNMNMNMNMQPVTGYTVDNMLSEFSRQLVANTKRYSNSHQQWHCNSNAMRVSKPGSANNSPRSATQQSRRRTLIGEGFHGRYHGQHQQQQQQPQQQAVNTTYLPTPASETHSEPFFERQSSRARPVSWHPSPSYQAYPQQLPSYPSYNESEIMSSFQQLPPTPAIYSGYTSPTESFSPLSLPYSGFSSQPVFSPQQQPQPASVFQPIAGTNYPASDAVSEMQYHAPPRVMTQSIGWDSYSTSSAMLNQHTAPPTPEDFSCPLPLGLDQTTPAKVEPVEEVQVQVKEDLDADEPEGEILYGLGLYDPPSLPKSDSMDLHRSTILSLLGGGEPPVPKSRLKLEEAWEPPVSDDDDEEEEDEEDGENEEDNE
ncbi:hypothetical protein QBC38DRAFT_214816 [Podospora fimiseda]|uniref:Uncharacterized protein n=1 Tax=Podospora fimiseda TaxID=252190 RepID=A0AAN7BNZ6_9PEZI|nr:hypothetical protein QBC38DRAFT_214816 [Podospora fimiseda]